MVVNGGGMYLEEIRKVINRKGVFAAAVTNNGKKGIELPNQIQISINYDDSRRDPYSLEEMFERIKNALLVPVKK